MFSIRLMIKYRHQDAPDPFAVIHSIFERIRYHDETISFSAVQTDKDGMTKGVFTITRGDRGTEDGYPYALDVETVRKQNFGCLLVEICYDEHQNLQALREKIGEGDSLLFRYLKEWLELIDADYASIHTSLEPLSFAGLDEEGFPARLGWITWFGDRLCTVIGRDLLLDARPMLYNACTVQNRQGVLWQLTSSILDRTEGLGRYQGLRTYLDGRVFRPLQLVESSWFSLAYTLAGHVQFSAEIDDIETAMEAVCGCTLEQYKDLWDTADGRTCGLDVSISYSRLEKGYSCSLFVNSRLDSIRGRDVIRIDISDYLYTLLRMNSMLPDPQPAGLDIRPPKNALYALCADIEFMHPLSIEPLSERLVELFDCQDHSLCEGVLTVRVLGLLLTVSFTHEFGGLSYYSLKARYAGKTDESWRSIDISNYFITMLETGGVLQSRDLIFRKTTIMCNKSVN